MDYYKENPMYKSGESTEVDSALWLLYNKMSTYYGYLDYVISDLARVEFSVPEEYVFIDFKENKGYSVTEQNISKYIHFFELMYGLPFDKPNCDPPIEL